ncbi:antibiotic biosynthesis monooxygenase [Bacteroidota bacterium]
MVVTLVHVEVKPEYIDEFIEATIINHNHSTKEEGNLRFDLIQDEKNPEKFIIYEAYNSMEAVSAHKETSHYHSWRTKVADMMAKPREGIRYKILAPSNDA